MKKAIYKYENKINHKIYIGRTNNPDRRYNEHLYGHSYHTSLLERAIKKYGIEQFSFEVLEWTEDYDNREKYWINHFNCYKPYGYNICEGGGYLPNNQGENHSQCKISEETARAIQNDLMDWKIPRRQIIKKHKVTSSIVENIQTGHTWNYYGLTYPLRPSERELDNLRAERVIFLLQNSQKSISDIAREVGWGKSQISMINRGDNHFNKEIKYPIRPNPKDYSGKVEECVKLLKEGKSNSEISKILGTSSAWVSRINTGKSHKNINIIYPIRK